MSGVDTLTTFITQHYILGFETVQSIKIGRVQGFQIGHASRGAFDFQSPGHGLWQSRPEFVPFLFATGTDCGFFHLILPSPFPLRHSSLAMIFVIGVGYCIFSGSCERFKSLSDVRRGPRPFLQGTTLLLIDVSMMSIKLQSINYLFHFSPLVAFALYVCVCLFVCASRGSEI